MYKKSPHYIVKTSAGKYGTYYWTDRFVGGKCPVYFMDEKGVNAVAATFLDPRILTIIISVNIKGKPRRMVRLPRIN